MVGIVPFEAQHREQLLALSLRAWEPVFSQLRHAVPAFVYANFYPEGWRARQYSDLATVLDEEPDGVEVAVVGDLPVGWLCIRLHPEDSMGEIYVLVVDPDFQRQGVARQLIDHAGARVKAAGMRMLMVETGDDPGHAPARLAYESAGFVRWHVARYFADLSDGRQSQQ